MSQRWFYEAGDLPPAPRSNYAEPDEDGQLLDEGQRQSNHGQVWHKGPLLTAAAEEELGRTRFCIVAIFAVGKAAQNVGGCILELAFGGRACHPAARSLPVSIFGARDAETEATA
jgi:hypothetical protein